VGPATSQESAERVGEQFRARTRGFADSGGAASAVENSGESRSCSNVASGPARAELLALVDASIIALDAGETD